MRAVLMGAVAFFRNCARTIAQGVVAWHEPTIEQVM
jgi:hypothetical protein